MGWGDYHGFDVNTSKWKLSCGGPSSLSFTSKKRLSLQDTLDFDPRRRAGVYFEKYVDICFSCNY
ncbi:hypothetical protein YC2023_067363 [Brassica napus]